MTTLGLLLCSWMPGRGRTELLQHYIETAMMLDPDDGVERPADEVLAKLEALGGYQPPPTPEEGG